MTAPIADHIGASYVLLLILHLLASTPLFFLILILTSILLVTSSGNALQMVNLTFGAFTSVITIFETESVWAIWACRVVHAVAQAPSILIFYHTALVRVIVMLILSKAHNLDSSIQLNTPLELATMVIRWDVNVFLFAEQSAVLLLSDDSFVARLTDRRCWVRLLLHSLKEVICALIILPAVHCTFLFHRDCLHYPFAPPPVNNWLGLSFYSRL